MSAQRFRRIPADVEAIQFKGDNVAEIMKWSGSEDDMDDGSPCRELVVETLHGEVTALVGDWIVQGPAGDMWPVTETLFRQLYELVED